MPLLKSEKDEKKITITVTDPEKSYLEDCALQFQRMPGPTLHWLLRTIASLDQDTRSELTTMIMDHAVSLEEHMESSQGFFRDQLETKIATLKNLAKFFNRGWPAKASRQLREVKIKDGSLWIPKDWIIVNEEEASIHRYACVLECQNGETYGIPHFVYLCDYRYGCDYPEDFYEEFKRKIRPLSTKFVEIELNQVRPLMGNNGHILNGMEFLKAPIIGFFHIYESTDDYFKTKDEAPFGCVIVRDNA